MKPCARMRLLWLPLSVAVALATMLGCAGREIPIPPQAEAPKTQTYVIGPGDVLDISVWKNKELSVEVPVRTDGMISVPLLDDIHAAGMTPEQLKQLITRELNEYVSNADVTVIVKQSARRVYVLGEVVRSGPIALVTDLRVVDALSAAGGFGPFADKHDVKIIRHDGKKEVTYRFDYEAFVKGKAPGTNILLEPGDTIVVPD